MGVVERWVDTGSVLKIVSLEAWETVSVISMSSALVRNWNAFLVSIENPVLGAAEADLVIIVPNRVSSSLIWIHWSMRGSAITVYLASIKYSNADTISLFRLLLLSHPGVLGYFLLFESNDLILMSSYDDDEKDEWLIIVFKQSFCMKWAGPLIQLSVFHKCMFVNDKYLKSFLCLCKTHYLKRNLSFFLQISDWGFNAINNIL